MVAARFSRAQLRCREATGSSNAWILRVHCSRLLVSGAIRRSYALRPPHRAILQFWFRLAQTSEWVGGSTIKVVSAIRCPAHRKLTNRALDVEVNPGHLRKQIDIDDSDR